MHGARDAMVSLLVLIFALCLGFVIYTYFIYPLLIAAIAQLHPRNRCLAALPPVELPTLSVVVAGFNEAANLPGRVANLLAQDYPAEKFDIILVSDGSTDETPAVIDALATAHPGRIQALPLALNQGKAAALNAGIANARGELIVFADARQRFAPDVLTRLAENFADPEIGSASGELMFTTGDPDQAANGECAQHGGGVAAQVGLYWKYEKWMRRNESRLDSMLGATGAIYAIRRELYRPLPPGTLLDDFLTPMRIVLKGKRAIFDPRALAWDRPSTRAGQEFARKVRTLAGNYQAFALEPGLLLPWRNPQTWWQVWSHKVFRLWVPFALALMLCSTLALLGHEAGAGNRTEALLCLLLLAAQGGFYGLAAWGWQCEKQGRTMPHKIVSLAYTFSILNLAAALALWNWLRGSDHRGLWRKAYGAGGPE